MPEQGEKMVKIVKINRGSHSAYAVGVYEWTPRKRDGKLYLRKIEERGARWAKRPTRPLIELADAVAREVGAEPPSEREKRERAERAALAKAVCDRRRQERLHGFVQVIEEMGVGHWVSVWMDDQDRVYMREHLPDCGGSFSWRVETPEALRERIEKMAKEHYRIYPADAR